MTAMTSIAKRKAAAHAEAVEEGADDTVLRGENLSPRKDNGEDDDERQIYAHGLVEHREISLQDELRHGDDGGDGGDVNRHAHLGIDPISDDGDHDDYSW